MGEAHKTMMNEHETGSAAHEFHKSANAFHLKKAEHHDNASDEHADMGEFCVECAKSLSQAQKAMGMDSDAIMPDFVSSIAPELPQNFRAIPRAGQREVFGKASDGVDAALVKVLGFDEDN